jgi:hypothetical protein
MVASAHGDGSAADTPTAPDKIQPSTNSAKVSDFSSNDIAGHNLSSRFTSDSSFSARAFVVTTWPS